MIQANDLTIDEYVILTEHRRVRIHQLTAIVFLTLISILAGDFARCADAQPPPITHEQAAQLIETLKDPAKRERFTSLLEAYVAASPPASSTAASASPATAAAASSPPVSPLSKPVKGPSVLRQFFDRIQLAGVRFGQDVRAVTDARAFGEWLHRFDDPTERSGFLDAALRVALICALTLGVEMLARWSMRRRANFAQNHPERFAASSRLQSFERFAVRFGALIGAGIAGNVGILFIADFPVARTVAVGIVNTYIVARLLLGLLDMFAHAEAQVPPTGTSAQFPAGFKFVMVAFLIAVALQLLSGDLAHELGAPDDLQESLEKCIGLISHVLAIMVVLVSRAAVSRWIRSFNRPDSRWVAVTDAIAAIWPTVAVCAIAGSWLVWALDIPDAYREIVRVSLATLAVLFISRLLSRFVLSGLESRMAGLSNAPAGTFTSRLFGYRNPVRFLVKVILVTTTLLVLTEAWGLPSFAWLTTGHPGHRIAQFFLQTLVLAIIGIACWEGADLAFERRVNGLVNSASLSRATRLRTLQPIVRFALLVVIALLVVMTALNAIGINVGPLLAGASIVGVALGFGSQKLVQDFITGIFLLVEDAMDVGDWVTLAGVSGTVEHISIRSIRLRGGDGSVYLVPFSSVTSVNNTNRGLGNAAVSVNVDPSEDTDKVCALLTELAQVMRKEPEFAPAMLSDLQLWGVDKVDGSVVTIAGQIVCTDAGRWSVQREFNRRMKQAFDKEGIKLAIPQQSLHIAAAGQGGGKVIAQNPAVKDLG